MTVSAQRPSPMLTIVPLPARWSVLCATKCIVSQFMLGVVGTPFAGTVLCGHSVVAQRRSVQSAALKVKSMQLTSPRLPLWLRS